jgi:hypothetical protein
VAITHFGGVHAEHAPYAQFKPAKKAAIRAVHDDIHPGVYVAFVGCWAALIAVFVSTFVESPFTLFMLALVSVYAIMFFGVPYVMSRVAPPKTKVGGVPFRSFLRGKVQTLTGPIGSKEALAQVLMVPLALTLGALFISFIIHFEADHIHMLYIAQSGPFPQ